MIKKIIILLVIIICIISLLYFTRERSNQKYVELDISNGLKNRIFKKILPIHEYKTEDAQNIDISNEKLYILFSDKLGYLDSLFQLKYCKIDSLISKQLYEFYCDDSTIDIFYKYKNQNKGIIRFNTNNNTETDNYLIENSLAFRALTSNNCIISTDDYDDSLVISKTKSNILQNKTNLINFNKILNDTLTNVTCSGMFTKKRNGNILYMLRKCGILIEFSVGIENNIKVMKTIDSIPIPKTVVKKEELLGNTITKIEALPDVNFNVDIKVDKHDYVYVLNIISEREMYYCIDVYDNHTCKYIFSYDVPMISKKNRPRKIAIDSKRKQLFILYSDNKSIKIFSF